MTNGKKLLVLGIVLTLAIGIVGIAQAATTGGSEDAKPGRAAMIKSRLAKAWAARKAKNNPDAMAQRIADMSGLSKETILSYKEDGLTWPQVMDKAGLTFTKVAEYRAEQHDAAMAKKLSALSGKTEAEVLAMKTDDNTWKDVMEALGITPEKLRERAKTN